MYHCEFCNYSVTTNNKRMIHKHHIIPRGCKGSTNKPNNIIIVCPNCHNKIFSEQSTYGIHSTLTEDSIIIHGWKLTTLGKVLYYTINGKEFFQESKN